MLRGLDKMGFKSPTAVQNAAIAPTLDKKDLLVQAPTGTGKTCAFGIPTVEAIDTENRSIQTIILCPTRELVLQTTAVLRQLTAFKPGIGITALYGGQPIQHQISALRRKPQIVVATPGRMLDHIRRRTTRLGEVKLVVLDEADRMLDMGFRDDMDAILENVPEARQTILFSATMSKEITDVAHRYQHEAERIHIQSNSLAVDLVEQHYSPVRRGAKTKALLQLLNDNSFERLLVFVATKAMADSLAKELCEGGFSADALHGDLRQKQRDTVMRKYRTGAISILVATDVAARGIDVDNISAVINYDIPIETESYVHRIGRTGRAGQTGIAHTFVYPHEMNNLQQIISATGAQISLCDLGFTPPPYRQERPSARKTGGYKPGKDKYKGAASRGKSRRGGQGQGQGNSHGNSQSHSSFMRKKKHKQAV